MTKPTCFLVVGGGGVGVVVLVVGNKGFEGQSIHLYVVLPSWGYGDMASSSLPHPLWHEQSWHT